MKAESNIEVSRFWVRQGWWLYNLYSCTSSRRATGEKPKPTAHPFTRSQCFNHYRIRRHNTITTQRIIRISQIDCMATSLGFYICIDMQSRGQLGLGDQFLVCFHFVVVWEISKPLSSSKANVVVAKTRNDHGFDLQITTLWAINVYEPIHGTIRCFDTFSNTQLWHGWKFRFCGRRREVVQHSRAQCCVVVCSRPHSCVHYDFFNFS